MVISGPNITEVGYSANLLGIIASHLEGLQGYGVMALELLQNADDAKARDVVFDVGIDGLLVQNDKDFSACDQIESRNCAWEASPVNGRKMCDFHSLREVGSRSKLNQKENIGRFGIGFVSVYQITDRPVVISSCFRLELRPEEQKANMERVSGTSGTEIWLPWASNQDSPTRGALKSSAFQPGDKEALLKDLTEIVSHSAIFLRNVHRLEIKSEGHEVASSDITELDERSILIQRYPDNSEEIWLVLQRDGRDEASKLVGQYPALLALDRSSQLSVAIRIDPSPIESGLIYAYLPTNQRTGMSFHVNADFFPEPNRKHIVLEGRGHQRAWNEMLLEQAAEELADNLVEISRKIGHIETMQLLDQARSVAHDDLGIPEQFSIFWAKLSEKANSSNVIKGANEEWLQPSELFLPSLDIDGAGTTVLRRLGIELVHPDLVEFNETLEEIGVRALDASLMRDSLAEYFEKASGRQNQVSEKELREFYRPLWNIMELLFELRSNDSQIIDSLKDIPFVLNWNRIPHSINDVYVTPPRVKNDTVLEFIPELSLGHEGLKKTKGLVKQIELLTFDALVHELQAYVQSPRNARVLLKHNAVVLRKLYSFIVDYPREDVSDEVFETLSKLPLWSSGKGLIAARDAVLPGNFSDPVGLAGVLDDTVLSGKVREFLVNDLHVAQLTFSVFVEKHIPAFFEGEIDSKKCQALILELARHIDDLNDKNLREILRDLPLVPTRNKGWGKPRDVYFYNNRNALLLGENPSRLIDEPMLPKSSLVKALLATIGVLEIVHLEHIIEYLHYITKERPTEEIRKKGEEIFYEFCNRFGSLEKGDESGLDEFAELRDFAFLPADGNEDLWFCPGEVFAPFRSQAYESQLPVLSFKNTNRLNRDFLSFLNIHEPTIDHVVSHLSHCIENSIPPHYFVYQILNEGARDSEILKEIEELAEKACIYDESNRTFIYPYQIYWSNPNLGRFGYKVPSALENFRPLLNLLGVKETPDVSDFLRVLQDLGKDYEERTTTIDEEDKKVWFACARGVASATEGEDLPTELIAEIERVRDYPCMLTEAGDLLEPSEVSFSNADWLARKFPEEEIKKCLVPRLSELFPFYKVMGVARLTDSVEVQCNEMEDAVEWSGVEVIRDRAEALERLLYSQAPPVHKRFRSVLENVDAEECNSISVSYRFRCGGSSVDSEEHEERAFFDETNCHLCVGRPVDNEIWYHSFREVFYSLIPDYSGDFGGLVNGAVSVIEADTLDQAHKRLTLSGYSEIQEDEIGVGNVSESKEIGPLGAGDESERPAPSNGQPLDGDHTETEEEPSEGQESGTGGGKGTGIETPQDEREVDSATNGQEVSDADIDGEETETEDGQTTTEQERRRNRRRRASHARQLSKLISYVSSGGGKGSTGGVKAEEDSETIQIGEAAVAAVCEYERVNGRDPIPKAHNQPGYDVESIEPHTGEKRYIEVKGVDGEWGKLGVGLTKVQFRKAQTEGDEFWLYVVEFARDRLKAQVHAIQNPPRKISNYYFDHQWKLVSDDSKNILEMLFVKGRRINHKVYGDGTILEVKEEPYRGKSLVIQFDSGGKSRERPLNLDFMEPIVEDNSEEE